MACFNIDRCTSIIKQFPHNNIFLKVWWHCATLLVDFDIIYCIHSFHHIHTVLSSVVFRRGFSPSPNLWSVYWEEPPWGAEPRIELGPALQQADALPTENVAPSELRRTLWTTPHPNELRRTPQELTSKKKQSKNLMRISLYFHLQLSLFYSVYANPPAPCCVMFRPRLATDGSLIWIRWRIFRTFFHPPRMWERRGEGRGVARRNGCSTVYMPWTK